jgi:pimeloyl-ACP methyl ester carboxylesterase
VSADAFVLVHGGFHDRRCWERLIPLLERPVLAVDLPGRGTRPAKLQDVTLESCVRSVVADIEQAGLSRVVLVGHSMGGATVPVVAARIPDRIAHLVLLSTLVAPEGGSLVDGFVPETREAAIRRLGTGENVEIELSEAHHRELLCNDMNEADIAWCLARVGPDSRRLFTDRASRADLPDSLPRTYVRLRRDRSVTWAQQAHAISLLPGLAVREIDAPHQAMVTHPREVAEILNALIAADGPRPGR